MQEKVLTGIAFIALCAMFYCMMWAVGSERIVDAVAPIIGIIVSGAIAIHTSNSIEYDDEEE